MNLTEDPQTVTWPKIHYAFLERVGPFETNAMQAWADFVPSIPKIAEHNQIKAVLSLYKIGPQIYRAGVAIAAPPQHLPEGIRSMEFDGGKYSRFVLTGPYSEIGPATDHVMKIVSASGLPVRDDYFLENYLNDPATTPEAELITEILVPTAEV
jgi:effector-binding domain-containing protein